MRVMLDVLSQVTAHSSVGVETPSGRLYRNIRVTSSLWLSPCGAS